MPINPLTGLGNIAQQSIQRTNERLHSAIASLVSGKRLNKAGDDVAALSVATQLQTALSSLREVSANAAQAASLTQVAEGGVDQITDVVQQLRDLAQQAQSPTLNQANRDALNDQFQQLAAEVDRIAANTTFNGKSLLDGSLSGGNALSISTVISGEGGGEEGASLSIADLSSSSLFNGQPIDILSADGATQALDVLSTALGATAAVQADIGAFQQSVDYIAASIDSAIANQDAARSVLEDTDLAQESTIYAQLQSQRDAGIAVAAQSNRLPSGLLRLVE